LLYVFIRVDYEDLKVSLRDLAEVLEMISLVMLVPIAVSFYYLPGRDPILLLQRISAFLIPSVLLFLLYLVLKYTCVTPREAITKHITITVVLSWVVIALVGALPFVIRGTLGPLDAFFESASGWTTTGMTMIPFPEDLVSSGHQDMVFYRALTHIVGGVGIITLGLMVLLRGGTAAMEYYASERGSLKIKPNIRATVIETWKIYGFYTLVCLVLLNVLGMGLFDSIIQSFATLSTGGFSSYSDSVGHFNNWKIDFVLIFFMAMGGISFLLHYTLQFCLYLLLLLFKLLRFKSQRIPRDKYLP